MKKQVGDQLERYAEKFLGENGLQILETNYLCKLGEIDIIAKDNSDYVFVEVRYRKSEAFGGAAASVNRSKQSRIVKAAGSYLQTNKLANRVSCRFDVVAISGSLDRLDYNWIKAAFT
jgi:putative endonuclease